MCGLELVVKPSLVGVSGFVVCGIELVVELFLAAVSDFDVFSSELVVELLLARVSGCTDEKHGHEQHHADKSRHSYLY